MSILQRLFGRPPDSPAPAPSPSTSASPAKVPRADTDEPPVDATSVRDVLRVEEVGDLQDRVGIELLDVVYQTRLVEHRGNLQ